MASMTSKESMSHGRGTNYILVLLLLLLGVTVLVQYRERVQDRLTIHLLEAQFRVHVDGESAHELARPRSFRWTKSKSLVNRPQVSRDHGLQEHALGTSVAPLLTTSHRGAPCTSDQGGSSLELPTGPLFLYQPSGGWNNQRLILSRAVRICKILNRTCLVPMYGAHTSFYQNYNKLQKLNLLRMDRIVDSVLLSGYHKKLFFLEQPLPKFREELEAMFPNKTTDWEIIEQTPRERIDEPLLEGHIYRLAESCTRKIVYFAGSTMWQPFSLIPKSFEEEVIPYFRYAPFFRAVAQDFGRSVLGNRKYLSIHLRLEDISKRFYKRKRPINVADYFTKKLVQAQRNRKLPVGEVTNLYIAQMPGTNLTIIKDLNEAFHVYTSANFSANPLLLKEFDTLFDLPLQIQLRNDVLGIIDQLICINSHAFVGTAKSTFSEYVQRVRRYPVHLRKELFQLQNRQV